MPRLLNHAVAAARKWVAEVSRWSGYMAVKASLLCVDGDVEELCADALDAVAAVAGDAVRGPLDAHQALDVEVHHVARGGVFLANDRCAGFEIADAAQLHPALDDCHGKFLTLMHRGSGMIVIVHSVSWSVACWQLQHPSS